MTQLDLDGKPVTHKDLSKIRVALIKLETLHVFAQRFADSRQSPRLQKEMEYAYKYVREVLEWR